MAVDMRARYFGEFDEGAMAPSFSVYPQYELPNSDFMVMPPAAAQAPAQQYLPAVQPMTQEAAAPYDLSGLDLSSLAGLDLSGLYGMNFGTDFGGGAMGGIYPDDPNTEFIAAPLSNKGNATSRMGGNAFEVRVDQPVRLVDHSTNQVVFEGTGYDAARKATELGQGLSDTLGRKANYSIQTADPTGNYSTVAYETKNKSTLGEIANVAGTVLPLAMMAIPGVNAALLGTKLAATTAGQVALGALTGAASSGLKGQNVLKGAALGGLTAAGGALIPKIPAIGDLGNLARPIGTGIGSTVGNLVTGQNLQNSLLSGAASGALAYAAPSIQDAFKGTGQGSGVSAGGGGDTSVSYGGPNADIIVNATPSFSAPINLGGFKTPAQKYLDDAASDNVSNPLTNAPYSSGYDGDLINVTGSTPIPGTNVNVGGGDTGALSTVADTTLGQTGDTATEQIDVTGTKLIPGTNVNIGGGDTGALSTVADTTLGQTGDGGAEQIDVTGSKLIPGTNVNIGGSGTGALSTVTDTTLGQTGDGGAEQIDVTGTKLIPGTNVNIGGSGTGALSTVTDTTLGQTGDGGAEQIDVTGTKLIPGTNVTIGGSGTGALSTVTDTTTKGDDTKKDGDKKEIDVTGTKLIPGTNVNVGGDTGALSTVTDTTTKGDDTKKADDTKKDDDKKEIDVTGTKLIPGTNVDVGDGFTLSDDTLKDINKKAAEEQEKKKKKKLSVADALALLKLADGLIGGGGGGGGGTPGSQALNPIFSAKLPTPGEGGAFKVGGLDYTTPPARSAADMYRYAMGPAMDIRAGTDLSKATSPYAGYGPGTLGEETFKRVTGMAHGGAMGYARGSSRDSFAVEGPGTGRSDDIPAVLSDGEYVIDAETVALLGDGSSKAGAKKLDEMRVKIRKHKGRNLAKGKFSVNARRPEKYLSGGRT